MSGETREYIVEVRAEGVRSLHDRLARDAETCSRAKRMSPDEVDVDGPDDDVEALIEMLLTDRG